MSKGIPKIKIAESLSQKVLPQGTTHDSAFPKTDKQPMGETIIGCI